MKNENEMKWNENVDSGQGQHDKANIIRPS